MAAISPSARKSVRISFRPCLEVLEDRLTPAVKTWTGSVNANWNNDGNWSGGRPAIGDDLVFPVNAQNKTSTNDFGAGRNFGSITFLGSAYVLTGNRIDLRENGTVLFANQAAGANTINLPINLGPGVLTIEDRFVTVS